MVIFIFLLVMVVMVLVMVICRILLFCRVRFCV